MITEELSKETKEYIVRMCKLFGVEEKDITSDFILDIYKHGRMITDIHPKEIDSNVFIELFYLMNDLKEEEEYN